MAQPSVYDEAFPDFYNQAGTGVFNMGPPPSFEFCELHPEVRQYVRCAEPASPADTLFKTSDAGRTQVTDDGGLLLLAVLAAVLLLY